MQTLRAIECVLDLVRCCEIVFLNHRNNYVIMHLSCFLGSLRTFDFADMTRAFLLFKNEQDSWFGPSSSFSSIYGRFVRIFSLMMVSLPYNISLNIILGVPVRKSKMELFFCLICHGNCLPVNLKPLKIVDRLLKTDGINLREKNMTLENEYKQR